MGELLIVLGYFIAVPSAALVIGALLAEAHPAKARRLADKFFGL